MIFFGILVYAALAQTVAIWSDFLVAIFCGLFVGLNLKKLSSGLLAGFLVGFFGSILGSTSAYFGSRFYAITINPFGQGIVSLGASCLIILAIKKWKMVKLLSLVLLALLILNFIAFAYSAATAPDPNNISLTEAASIEPVPEQYGFDAFIFLKTFYLMKRGNNYYQSFRTAIVQDLRISEKPTSVQNYRLPTLFWLWRYLLPEDGAYILYLFWLLSALSIICSYFFAKKLVGSSLSLVAPAMLSSYLAFGATTWWFLMAEYWGVFFAIFALTCYIYDLEIPSIVFATLAVLIRELFLFLPIAMLIGAIYSRDKKKIALWACPILIFSAVYIMHYLTLRPYLKSAPLNVQTWLHGGLGYVISTTQFGMDLFTQNLILRIAVPTAGFVGALLIPEVDKKISIFCCIALPVLGFLFFGSGQWGNYWGIIYVPIVLICTPLLALAYKMLVGKPQT